MALLRSVPLMCQISLIKNLYLVHRNMEEV